MSREELVGVQGVAKKFCRSLRRALWYGVLDMAGEVVGRARGGEELRPDEFWAVHEVSFGLRRGECLGLIGRNGAGKTTLLRILSGLIKPDAGRVTMRGRVGALIALGAGFNPLLSGRENIYVNGAILGLPRREIHARVDEIIDFAELREFIDAPVQSYSSGMAVRLGFAIASALQPDILILDEVLAVGDAAFRNKCYRRLAALQSQAAVILVSHAMDYIAQTCSRVLLLERGHAQSFDHPLDGIQAYEELNHATTSSGEKPVTALAWPIVACQVNVTPSPVDYGGELNLEFMIDSEVDLGEFVLSFSAVNDREQTVLCWHSTREQTPVRLRAGCQTLRYRIAPLWLHDGVYRWSLCATRPGSIEHLIWYQRAGEFRVVSPFRPVGGIPYLPRVERL